MRVNLENITILLHRPSYPENVGAAARAAKNMGLKHLVVVSPQNCDLGRILKMATHWAEDVVVNMEVRDNLREALAPYHFVVGTTARTGSHRQTIRDPRKLAEELVSVSQKNRVVVVFGPEKTGLSNDDLKYCHALVTIPTADFVSLNLAQAVMVIAYEIFMAAREEPKVFAPRLAKSEEMEAMYDHLTQTLARINFINPENPEHWMLNVRRFLNRIGLRAREVKIIRGICRQIIWYCEKRIPGDRV